MITVDSRARGVVSQIRNAWPGRPDVPAVGRRVDRPAL